ncbi:MAG TPA: RQC domain-containing protein [Clostridia bacterium]|nr:RQC domain-containing protein [Clostridia bacterium]
MDEFYKYILLSLVSELNGERGKAFFISLLRGSKQKKVLYMLNKKSLWGYYNLLGLLSRSSVEAMYDELIESKVLQIKNNRLTDGFLYPLLHLDQAAKQFLDEKDSEFSDRLKEVFESNIKIIDISRLMLDLTGQPDSLPDAV